MKSQNDHLAYDWLQRSLPDNAELGTNVYIESSYVFAAFFSQCRPGMIMDDGIGAYDFTSFAAGPDLRINVGAYTRLNSVSLVCDDAISGGAYCLFAWGSVLTDSVMPRPGDVKPRRQARARIAQDPLRRLRPFAPAKPSRLDNAGVGFDSVIMGRVTIGRGAMIGCPTIITEDVLAYAIAVGNPSRLIRFLPPDHTEDIRLAALSEFGLPLRAAVAR